MRVSKARAEHMGVCRTDADPRHNSALLADRRAFDGRKRLHQSGAKLDSMSRDLEQCAKEDGSVRGPNQDRRGKAIRGSEDSPGN